VHSDSIEPLTPEAKNDAPASCNSEGIVVYVPQPSSESESPRSAQAREIGETARARAYLTETATPGYTMTRQGPERAIGRLHPAFVKRLAAAIEVRAAVAGIFYAYRPPAFGVGGFADKFHSLHTYGLAVDVTGIGAPGTPTALLWHEIAARHGVICPYGPHNLAEWNHCQPTQVKFFRESFARDRHGGGADRSVAIRTLSPKPILIPRVFADSNIGRSAMRSAQENVERLRQSAFKHNSPEQRGAPRPVVHWRSRRALRSVPVVELPMHKHNGIISKSVLPNAPKSSPNRLTGMAGP
jgi:hypothetical protein